MKKNEKNVYLDDEERGKAVRTRIIKCKQRKKQTYYKVYSLCGYTFSLRDER